MDASGRTVEVFTTWHDADQVVFDIDVINETGNVTGEVPPLQQLLHGEAGREPGSGGTEYGDLDSLTLRIRALALELEQVAKEIQGRTGQP